MARRRGSQVFQAFASIVGQSRAPQARAGLYCRLLGLLAIVVFHAAISLSLGSGHVKALDAAGSGTRITLAIAAEDGDPPLVMPYRGPHLKKPRVSALKVWTGSASRAAAPAPAFLAGHALSVSSEGTRASRAPLSNTTPMLRPDATRRLHPGQAPPRVA